MPPAQQPIPNPTDRIRSGINAFDDLADSIANPDPSRPLRNAIGASGRKYCDYVGAVPLVASNLLGPGLAISALLCKPYWDGQGYDAPVYSPPYSGGQCAGSEYRPEGTYINTNAAAGPTGARTWRLSSTLVGPLVGFVPGGSPTGAQWGFVSASNGGAPFGTPIDLVNSKPVFGPNNADSSSVMLSTSVPTITNVGLQFGPDNCGNPPGVPGPGANPPPTPTFPSGEEPGVDPSGKPYFTVPPIDDPAGGGDPIDVPIDPGDEIPGPPPGPGQPGTPIGTGVGGDAEDEAEEGEMLWALKIDITALPEAPNRYADGVYRAVCYIYMGDDSGLDHDPAGAMLRDGQLVLAERDYLTKWRVAANPGYNLLVTPYYKPTEG